MEQGDRGPSADPSRGPRKFGIRQIRPTWLIVLGLIIGITGGLVLRASCANDSKIGESKTKLAAENEAITDHKKRADEADKKLAAMTAGYSELKAELEAKRVGRSNVHAADAAKAIEDAHAKLKVALDKGIGAITASDNEVRIQLYDRILFKPNDDELTDKGRAVLAKLGGVLNASIGTDIVVEGHTDDQPVPKPSQHRRHSRQEVFATNWELAAARALSVVHYLQDTAKIDPSRLTAQSFGPYRPASTTNRALNRRVELVLTPSKLAAK